jgi:hypothetical protein
MENIGSRPVKVIQFFPPPAAPPTDVTITINADNDRASGRYNNSDGNYYTITFPDDYLSGEDLFLSARSGSGKIGSGVDASANLDIILNIPVDMRIGANTANNLIPYTTYGTASDHQIYTDPAIHLKLDTDIWDSSILERLNITVNNYGYIIGSGGSGGYGGYFSVEGKSITYNSGDGGGAGQGLNPDWGTGTSDIHKFYDPTYDSGAFGSGQAGAGYGWWRIAGIYGHGANGQFGSIYTAGLGGVSADPQLGIPRPGSDERGGKGHDGGSVIYITSDVGTPTTGTHLNIYNRGWMFGGGGGGSGVQATNASGGKGGGWPGATQGTGTGVGAGGFHQTATSPIAGGNPGYIIHDNSTNLTVSNTIINYASNTIYGRDGTWPTT